MFISFKYYRSMNICFIFLLTTIFLSVPLNEAIASTDSDQNKTLLKGEVQESAENANIWQQLNARLIQGKCQLTLAIPQLIKAKINKNALPMLKASSSTFGAEPTALNANSTILKSRLRLSAGKPIKYIIAVKHGLHNNEFTQVVLNLNFTICDDPKIIYPDLPGLYYKPLPYDTRVHDQNCYNEMQPSPRPYEEFYNEIQNDRLHDEWQHWVDNLTLLVLKRWALTRTGLGEGNCNCIIYNSGKINAVLFPETYYRQSMEPSYRWYQLIRSEYLNTENYDRMAKNMIDSLSGADLRFPLDSKVSEVHLGIELGKPWGQNIPNNNPSDANLYRF